MRLVWIYLIASLVTAWPSWWFSRRVGGEDAGVVVMIALTSWAVVASVLGALIDLTIS